MYHFYYNEIMDKLRNTCYYEFRTIDEPDTVVQTGMRTLGSISLTTGIDSVPTLSFSIPLEDLPVTELDKIGNGEYVEPRLQRYTVTVYFQIDGKTKYRFQGTIDRIKIDYANYLVQLELSHTVARMREWAMPVNYSVKSKTVVQIISEEGAALGYANPPIRDVEGYGNFSMQSYDQTINFVFQDEESANTVVTMTFGSNNKLGALSELINNTEKLHFCVDLSAEEDTVIIGAFDKECSDVVISPYSYNKEDCEEDANDNFVTMLTEPKFNVDYTKHFNRAVVFCGDIQDGVNHLTLEQYYSGELEPLPEFPVGKYEYELNQLPETVWDEDSGQKINNEKYYKDFEIISYSKNGNREFYVEDKWQLERDSGVILNTVYNFNDLYPIPQLKQDIDDDGEMEELVITNGDRLEIVRQAYYRAVRKLKAQRPERSYQMNTTALPFGTSDGQRIRLQYAKSVYPYQDDECDKLVERKIINIDECLYLTKRTITFDEALNETTTVTLDAELRVKDVSATEVELLEDASDDIYANSQIHGDLGNLTFNDRYNSAWGVYPSKYALPGWMQNAGSAAIRVDRPSSSLEYPTAPNGGI